MTPLILLAGSVLAMLTGLHFASLALVALRLRRRTRRKQVQTLPAVSVLVPVCGLENHLATTLGSAFALDHPRFELIFCVASAGDPAVPLVERLIAENPGIPARILYGAERPSANPKLNNLMKGWLAAEHEWILMADSNVLLPPDALDRLAARCEERNTGLVCSPPIGSAPAGLAAEIEAGFLNTYQGRWQLLADMAGLGFGQGKAMLWRREVIDQAGGLLALAAEAGEDAAATKILRARGLKVRLAESPFFQPLGRRHLRDVWMRQIRWARLRRGSFPLLYLPELFAGAFFPLAALIVLIAEGAVPVLSLPVLIICWYGAEFALARHAGWPAGLLSPIAFLLRDLSLPVLWLGGWGTSFVSRGNGMDAGGRRSAADRLARQLALRRAGGLRSALATIWSDARSKRV